MYLKKQSSKIFYLMIILLAVSIISDASIISNDIVIAGESIEYMNEIAEPLKRKNIFEITEKAELSVESFINDLTLKQKCAQLVMPAVYRGALNPSSREYAKVLELVQEYGVGGVVLFQGSSQDQKNMLWRLQSLAKIPLLVAGDYENGLGMRIDDAVSFPHSMAIGATQNPDFAYEVGKATAIEGRKIGINFNLAPVADVNDNPLNPIINIRAYSQDKQIVSSFVNAFIKGSDDGKMLTSVKHFPGHGNTLVDSHDDIPRIYGSKEYLLQNELYPFIKSIDHNVKSIMIGHLEVSSLDSNSKVPASLSYPVITELLKEELGFEGLIITDAIDMRAITKYYSQEEAAVKAVLAGNDIVLAPLKPKEAIEAIYNAVIEGVIDESRINESVKKIFFAKYWLGLFEDISAGGHLDSENQKLLAQKIADESVTLLKNDENLLPLNLNDYKNIATISITDGPGGLITEYFSDLLKEKRYDVSSYKISRTSKKRDYDKVKENALKGDLIIVTSFIRVRPSAGPVGISQTNQDFIQSIIDSGRKVVFISFNNPYLISRFPLISTYINTYSNTTFSQIAAFKAVLGEIEFKGKLPVSIPDTNFKIGDGINFNLTSIN